MTINYSCLSYKDRCYRLPFGVPLEDIFPRPDLHPYLKKIFIKAFNDITSSGHSLEEVICKLQGNVAERLILKEIVTSCKPMPLEFPPGALLWILRHFLGLLPVPLLPDYTNKEYFSWRRLSSFCKRSFLKYTSVETNNRLLIRKLAEELLRLPSVNLLLFSVLLNFIRALSCEQNKYGKTNLNKVAAFCLVKYFSSSIFIRRFAPGRHGKIDRHYFPLLFYLVLKWPEVERYFGSRDSLNSIPSKNIEKSYDYHPQFTPEKIKIKDNCTQTETNLIHDDWLGTIFEESIDGSVDFLRDTACQTDTFSSEHENIGYYPSNGSNNRAIIYKKDSDGVIDFLRDTSSQTEPLYEKHDKIRCCCSYGKNYRSFLYENDSLSKYCQANFVEDLVEESDGTQFCATNSDVNSETTPNLHEKTPSLNKQSQTSFTQDVFEESTARATNKRSISTITDKEYLNSDSQSHPNLKSFLRSDVGTNTDYPMCYGWVTPTISSRSPRNRLDFCSPQTFLSENHYVHDDCSGSTLNLLGHSIDGSHCKQELDLLGRISKIGWTYTPPRSTCVTSPTDSPMTGSKTTMKEENYTSCTDEKERRTKEEKESCSSGNSLKSKCSVGSAKSKKSFSITNIKKKLDFFKFFTGKRKKLKNSCSFEEISNIKYKKMNSVKSTLF